MITHIGSMYSIQKSEKILDIKKTVEENEAIFLIDFWKKNHIELQKNMKAMPDGRILETNYNHVHTTILLAACSTLKACGIEYAKKMYIDKVLKKAPNLKYEMERDKNPVMKRKDTSEKKIEKKHKSLKPMGSGKRLR